MPEIFIYMFEGRSLEQKRELVRRVTQGVVESLSVPADSVTVQLVENPTSMRSRGGVLFSDRAAAPATPPAKP
jgi:4-oxalocrotonate tautomerase